MKKKEAGSNSAEAPDETGRADDPPASMDRLAELTKKVLAAGKVQDPKGGRQGRDVPP